MKSALVLFGATRWSRRPALDAALAAPVDVFMPEHELMTLTGAERERCFGLPLSPFPTQDELTQAALVLTREYADRWGAYGLDDYNGVTASLLDALGHSRFIAARGPMTALNKALLRRVWNAVVRDNAFQWARTITSQRVEFATFSPTTGEIRNKIAGFFRPHATPYILKPSALDASVGIRRVRDEQEAIAAITEVLGYLGENIEYARTQGVTLRPTLLMEEEIQRSTKYSDSGEFSVEVFSANGQHSLVGITEKFINPNNFIELGHIFPARRLPEDLAEKIELITTRVVAQLGVSNAVSHFEVILDADDRIALVEGQLRPAGDNITDLVRLATGRDLYSDLFLSAFEEPRPTAGPHAKVAGIFYLAPKGDCIDASAVDGGNHPALQRVIVNEELFKTSRWMGPTGWDNRYLAIICAVGAGEEIADVADECADMVRVKLKSGDSIRTYVKSHDFSLRE